MARYSSQFDKIDPYFAVRFPRELQWDTVHDCADLILGRKLLGVLHRFSFVWNSVFFRFSHFVSITCRLQRDSQCAMQTVNGNSWQEVSTTWKCFRRNYPFTVHLMLIFNSLIKMVFLLFLFQSVNRTVDDGRCALNMRTESHGRLHLNCGIFFVHPKQRFSMLEWNWKSNEKKLYNFFCCCWTLLTPYGYSSQSNSPLPFDRDNKPKLGRGRRACSVIWRIAAIRINCNNKMDRVECVTLSCDLRPAECMKNERNISCCSLLSPRHCVSPISTSYSFNPLAPKSGVTSYGIFLLAENMHTWMNAKKIFKINICKNIAFEFRMKFIREYCRWSKCIRIIGLLWIICSCSHRGLHENSCVGIGCVANVTISNYAHVICALWRQKICTSTSAICHDMLAIRLSY